MGDHNPPRYAGRGGEAARWARVRDGIGEEFARTDGLNLDRKQMVLNLFFALEKEYRSASGGAGDRRT